MNMGQDHKHKSYNKGPRRRSSALRFFASNTSLRHESHVQSQKEWEAEYLKSLRTDRPNRPGGSRPLPARNTPTPDLYTRAASAMSFRHSEQQERGAINEGTRCASALSHRRARSDIPKWEEGSSPGGRSLVQPPQMRKLQRDCSGLSDSTDASLTRPPLAYRESGLRWMEKQEARSLREALEDMDMREEAKVHAAAQDEASQLVWRHLNEKSHYEDAKPRKDYKEHLKEGAHARNLSQSWYEVQNDMSRIVAFNSDPASIPSSSNHRDSQGSDTGAGTSAANVAHPGNDEVNPSKPNTHIKWDSPEKKAYTNMAYHPQALKSGRRRSSGAKARNASGGPFNNPDDKIYEESDESRKSSSLNARRDRRIPTPLSAKHQNFTSKQRTVDQQSSASFKVPIGSSNRTYRSEIHKNPPSQSRNPLYLRNDLKSVPDQANDIQDTSDFIGNTRNREGVEIRSDDIRSATSMRLKDRSSKLPSPSFVSNKPGRHIVSFDKDWKQERSIDSNKRPSTPSTDGGVRNQFKPSMPTSTASAPVIPTINAPDAPSISIETPTEETPIPAISEPKSLVPSIAFPDDQPKGQPVTSGSNRTEPPSRPLPHHSSTSPVHTSIAHWSSASQRSTAQCAACALPIAGRIVSAASQRFHPHCFTCHHCSEPLECVAFYPEPEKKRAERLARIQSRLDATEVIEKTPGETAADDGDDSLRFYCHLDFHELFSPRCRSCKTPIETEVIIACGGSWHVGHFFCAECGDPFDAKTPFVEKDGYAWCVGCHAGRFSGKCKGCRKPVVEQGISALGAEWHEGCFVCVVSLRN